MNWTYMCIYKYRYIIHTYIFLYFKFNILRLLSCASQCQRDFLDFDSCVGFLASWGIAQTGSKIPRRIRCHPLCRWCRWCAGWRPTSRLWNGWVKNQGKKWEKLQETLGKHGKARIHQQHGETETSSGKPQLSSPKWQCVKTLYPCWTSK